jgi:proline iminopeptidase
MKGRIHLSKKVEIPKATWCRLPWLSIVASLFCFATMSSCIDPGDPGTLVPPTADQDPALPGIDIEYRGAVRRIHVREFGDPTKPALFILPGSASDVRAYLPLQVLADDYHVVMWDLPGNGLSERVPAEDLEFHMVAESIEAVRQRVSPNRPITLLGHSWSAAIATLYLAAHPEAVYQAVLMEPPGLTGKFQEQAGLALDLLAPGYLEMVWNAEYVPGGHEGLDYQMLAMSRSEIRHFFCPGKPNPEWPVWRPGALALIVWERSILDGFSIASYDFTEGLDRFTGEVLIVGTECSPIGAAFQERTNLTVFPHARLLNIANSNHRILTEQFDALMAGLRDFLDPAGVPAAGGGP